MGHGTNLAGNAGGALKRILMVLALAALLATVSAGVATGKQRQETPSPTPASDKSGGDDKGSDKVSALSTQSTVVKASFANGTGNNRLAVKVSDHGNLLSFESPETKEAVFNGREGYAVCSAGGGKIHGHDTGNDDAGDVVPLGFGTPTFAQPTAGAFPLTVTRNTTDGKFQLKQVWNQPDAAEKDVTVTMTLKNISSTTIDEVLLSRSGDFDIGTSPLDQGARTIDSAWQWDDRSNVRGDETFPGGLMLTAPTSGTEHSSKIESQSNWANTTSGSRHGCESFFEQTPTEAGDFAMRNSYFLGNVTAGQSKTVKFVYRRM